MLRAMTCPQVPRADGHTHFYMECDVTLTVYVRMLWAQWQEASDWLRLYTPNWAVSDFEGGVRLMSSDGRDQFKPYSSLLSKLEGSEAQLTEKQVVLLMHDIYLMNND